MGAAEGEFDPYTRLLNEHGAIAPGERPARVYDVLRKTNAEGQTISRAARTIAEAKVTTSEALRQFEQILQKGAFLAYEGLISGGRPEEDGQARLDPMQDAQNFALQIGDQSYTLDWLAPMALPFFARVEAWEAKGDSGQSVTDFLNAMSNIAEPMMELSLLQSVDNMIKAARYGNNAIADVGIELFSGYAGQGVPTLFGQVARTIDPVRRTVFVGKNSAWPEPLQRFGQKQAAKIPGLSQTPRPYVNQWGEAQKQAGGNSLGRVAQNFLSPGYVSLDESGPLENALDELYQKTGDKAVLPNGADKYFKVDGETECLNSEQYSRYTKERGQLSKRTLEELVSLPQYDQLTDAEKVGAVKQGYGYANAIAKSKVSAYKVDEQVQKVQTAQTQGARRKIATKNFSRLV